MNKSTWKSVGAVVAGLIAVVVVTTVVDIILHAVGVFPPWDTPIDDKLSVLATAYRIVISVAGAWLTAKLYRDRPGIEDLS